MKLRFSNFLKGLLVFIFLFLIIIFLYLYNSTIARISSNFDYNGVTLSVKYWRECGFDYCVEFSSSEANGHTTKWIVEFEHSAVDNVAWGINSKKLLKCKIDKNINLSYDPENNILYDYNFNIIQPQ